MLKAWGSFKYYVTKSVLLNILHIEKNAAKMILSYVHSKEYILNCYPLHVYAKNSNFMRQYLIFTISNVLSILLMFHSMPPHCIPFHFNFLKSAFLIII